MRTWRKVAFAKQMKIKKMMALNHFKCQMLFKYFYHLRRAPFKTRACVKLVRVLYRAGLGKPFAQMRRVYKQREGMLADVRSNHNTYVVQQIMAVWHSHAVKQKIAKMFFKRKYLSALQDHVFEQNYIRPAQLREHMLKRKAFYGFLQLKEAKWRKERYYLIERALEQKRALSSLRLHFNKLLDNILIGKRKRIILSTVIDFRKHSLNDKVFRIWKIYRAQKRR